jgi:hypothetical protein
MTEAFIFAVEIRKLFLEVEGVYNWKIICLMKVVRVKRKGDKKNV